MYFLGIDLRSFRHKRPFGYTEVFFEGIYCMKIDFPIGAINKYLFSVIGANIVKIYAQRILRASKPDIIHAHFTDIACIATKAFQDSKIPIVVTEHSSKINSDIISSDIKKCAFVAYRNASAVISVSNSLARRIYETFGIQATVIPNTYNSNVFSANRTNHTGFKFVVTANLVPIKNFELLLKAFKIIYSEFFDVELTIIGDGPLKQQIIDTINNYGLTNSVLLLGQLEQQEINNIYQCQDCFVLPSLSETFGVAYIEAMASGLPVIATRCGGPEDFVIKKTGILVDNNVDSLVNGMRFMYCNRKIFDSRYIHEYIESKFSDKTIARELVSLYSKTLELYQREKNIKKMIV